MTQYKNTTDLLEHFAQWMRENQPDWTAVPQDYVIDFLSEHGPVIINSDVPPPNEAEEARAILLRIAKGEVMEVPGYEGPQPPEVYTRIQACEALLNNGRERVQVDLNLAGRVDGGF